MNIHAGPSSIRRRPVFQNSAEHHFARKRMHARSCQRRRTARSLPERQERIVEHALALINLASNVVAMAAGIASLMDMVPRHHSVGGSSR